MCNLNKVVAMWKDVPESAEGKMGDLFNYPSLPPSGLGAQTRHCAWVKGQPLGCCDGGPL